MSNLPNGSGGIKRLAGLLTATKGRALAAAVILALIAGAGIGIASLRGAAPTKPAADSAPTATALEAATATLEPTLAATATPAPHVTPPTLGPGPVQRPTPSPIVASGPPQLSVNPGLDISEPNGCTAQYPNHFQNGFTVKNAGGRVLTWQVSDSTNMLATSYIQLTATSGSLAAGKSQDVQMYWVNQGPGPGGIPPQGSVAFTITSNGGDNQMRIECAPPTP